MVRTLALTTSLVALAGPAFAHPGHVESGFLHPLTGTDHLATEFGYGAMPHEQAELNMRLFAERVLPVLQRDPAFTRVETPGGAGAPSSAPLSLVELAGGLGHRLLAPAVLAEDGPEGDEDDDDHAHADESPDRGGLDGEANVGAGVRLVA